MGDQSRSPGYGHEGDQECRQWPYAVVCGIPRKTPLVLLACWTEPGERTGNTAGLHTWKGEPMHTDQWRPPNNAVVLFNGKDLNNWTTRNGKPAGWKVEDEILHVVPGTGDIMTCERFADFFLHLEFRCPDMPEATGQAKGNSGVFLQGRYEIQVLDSYGINIPGKGDCAAIYDQFAPLVNACRPPMQWQTYDVVFRGPRLNDRGEVTEGPRVTLLHNGLVVHNNVELPGVTGGALDEDVGTAGPLLLQDHKDLVAYRNIWAVPLPLEGSDTYEPR